MGEAMTANAQCSVGGLVQHKLNNYDGVVVDVDRRLMFSDELYESVARSSPPKDQPWYRVPVHDATRETSTAERGLEPDTGGAPVRHPLIAICFSSFRNRHYLTAG